MSQRIKILEFIFRFWKMSLYECYLILIFKSVLVLIQLKMFLSFVYLCLVFRRQEFWGVLQFLFVDFLLVRNLFVERKDYYGVLYMDNYVFFV